MLASLIALSLALLAGPVTIDEARLIAQEHAGTEMAPEPEIVQADGQPYLARFHPVDQSAGGSPSVSTLAVPAAATLSHAQPPAVGPGDRWVAIDIARAITKERRAPRFDGWCGVSTA